MIELEKQTNLDALQHEINRLRRAIRDCDKTHRIMPSPQLIMLEDRHNLLRSALSEIESFRRNQRSTLDEDYILPCDVKVYPATTITKGCKLGTLLKSIKLRENEE